MALQPGWLFFFSEPLTQAQTTKSSAPSADMDLSSGERLFSSESPTGTAVEYFGRNQDQYMHSDDQKLIQLNAVLKCYGKGTSRQLVAFHSQRYGSDCDSLLDPCEELLFSVAVLHKGGQRSGTVKAAIELVGIQCVAQRHLSRVDAFLHIGCCHWKATRREDFAGKLPPVLTLHLNSINKN